MLGAPQACGDPHIVATLWVQMPGGGELHPLAVLELGDFVLREREIPSLGAAWDKPQWGTHW